MAAEKAQTSSSSAAATADREIVITRILDAPRELVFNAWTDPRQVAQWWGPRGFTNTIHEMDVRPGGIWRFIMHGPDGVDYQNKIVFRVGRGTRSGGQRVWGHRWRKSDP